MQVNKNRRTRQQGEGPLLTSVIKMLAPVVGRLGLKFLEKTLEKPVEKIGAKLSKKITGTGGHPAGAQRMGTGGHPAGRQRMGTGGHPAGRQRMGNGKSKNA